MSQEIHNKFSKEDREHNLKMINIKNGHDSMKETIEYLIDLGCGKESVWFYQCRPEKNRVIIDKFKRYTLKDKKRIYNGR